MLGDNNSSPLIPTNIIKRYFFNEIRKKPLEIGSSYILWNQVQISIVTNSQKLLFASMIFGGLLLEIADTTICLAESQPRVVVKGSD